MIKQITGYKVESTGRVFETQEEAVEHERQVEVHQRWIHISEGFRDRYKHTKAIGVLEQLSNQSLEDFNEFKEDVIRLMNARAAIYQSNKDVEE
jgi:hypothetical protein